MTTYTTTIQMSKGYTGKTAAYAKGYIARITGTDSTYGLRREFLSGKSDSNDQYRKAKCTWNDVYELEPGLYELSEGGQQYLWIVSIKDGAAVKITASPERARKMAELMDAGETYDAARKATRPQA